jgi:hypothetical protein
MWAWLGDILGAHGVARVAETKALLSSQTPRILAALSCPTA